MNAPVDQLERQVTRAVDCIGTLRAEIRRLSRALEETTSAAREPSGEAGLPDDGARAAIDRLTEENERLRAERKTVLEQIRLLIREVEKVV